MDDVVDKAPDGYERTMEISFVRNKDGLLSLCQKWKAYVTNKEPPEIWVRIPTIRFDGS